MRVRLKGNWPGNFRRSVRDGKGQVRETMVFAPGLEVELTDEQAEACADAIPHALEVVEGEPRPAVDAAPKSSSPKPRSQKKKK